MTSKLRYILVSHTVLCYYNHSSCVGPLIVCYPIYKMLSFEKLLCCNRLFYGGSSFPSPGRIFGGHALIDIDENLSTVVS